MRNNQENSGVNYSETKRDSEKAEVSLDLPAIEEKATDLALEQARDNFTHYLNGKKLIIEEKALPLSETIKLLEKSDPEKAKKLLSRLLKITKGASATAAGGTFLFFSFVTASHQLSRYETKSKIDPQTQETVYEHEDPETTHIINVLAGKESLTDEEVTRMAKEVLLDDEVYENLKEGGIITLTKEEIVQADLATLENVLKNWQQSDLEKNPDKKPVEDYHNWTFRKDVFGLEAKADDTVYKALWEMMQESGNPKIRIQQNLGVPDKSKRGVYDSVTNTIYLKSPSIYILISEMAHGKQFGNNPYKSHYKSIRDILSVPIKMYKEDQGPISAYNELYSEEGTLENDAHDIIEPELEKEFYETTKEGPRAIEEKIKKEAKEKIKKEKLEQWKRNRDEKLGMFWKEEDEALSKFQDSLRKTKSVEEQKKLQHEYFIKTDEIRKRKYKTLGELDETKPR